ncbi:hypothetical protein [Wolbachia endosymbiont (group A) of Scambus nigricans]|uniref:hypothetical protein n=1 Tax=Wolbachia endosymbiont (group A) of Scambus nigricans TaxID=2954055 RepID=UPI002231C23D|nr:hypothetical protein [Wolbachia endosymbiont (group A) of Scambus nigricans]
MISKDNVPYYIAGTLATFTLLASEVFAAAPYIGFLAPVAALSVGLPFIALFTIIRTDRNMLLACYSHKHISYRIRTIIRKAILLVMLCFLL